MDIAPVNAVVAVDGAGRIRQFNAAAERTFGYVEGDVLDQPFLMLLTESCHAPYRLSLDKLFSSEETSNAGRTIELEGQRKDRSVFPLELCLVTWRSTENALYTAIVRDLTARKRIEAERAELLERVEELARTDEVTGLPNRRAWDEELRRELPRAARRGYPICIGMFDLDEFKSFNDTNGHLAGDALLQEIGGAFRAALRTSDFIARYGGDEFALLLPDCPAESANAVAQRICDTLPGDQTASAGLAEWDGSMSAEDLLLAADKALYEAKRRGRNQIFG